ncbi:NADP-dependent oxidoreductase [Streptomyces sp. NBC_00878]|uniref:NADP-dependent oxidoreductase n=1 Tax=Streptomyces sp. NBC_00878 TaxID=2975854 RepID=UPI0022507DD0|nr:NADP-dependent oxidoreductase [Streptomyces sp. NBC_00878]MCX4903871.1 NADP-dependent oxidoreductase [Streptomyces sp. NBC_00878]
MKAVVYRRYGGPEVLELTELPEPKTHVDSVLIRVRAAGLNRADAALQAGVLDSAVETFFPVVPGWDVAGVVERSGPGAPEFATGDEVIAYVRGDVQRAHGGFAELVSADVRAVARKPSTMSFTEAAGLPLAALTAYQGVVHALAVRRGESVLVHGAAGGVGSVAVQIALARGARVIGVGSADDLDYLRALGARAVAYGEGLTGEVLSLVPKGVDSVFDTVGGGTLAASAGAVRSGGRSASIAEPGAPGSTDVFARMDRADLTAVTALAEVGLLTVRVGAVFPLEKAAEAQRAFATGNITGKVVLEIG